MNKVILIGRLTKDPDIRYQGEKNLATLKTTLAVQRSYKDKDGNYGADFITISAFGKTCEFIEKYFHKGSQMVVEGEWRTGNYEKDGNKVFTNECVVSKVEFCGSKADNENTNQQTLPTPDAEPKEKKHNRPEANTSSDDDFVEIDSSQVGDIPFFGNN